MQRFPSSCKRPSTPHWKRMQCWRKMQSFSDTGLAVERYATSVQRMFLLLRSIWNNELHPCNIGTFLLKFHSHSSAECAWFQNFHWLPYEPDMFLIGILGLISTVQAKCKAGSQVALQQRHQHIRKSCNVSQNILNDCRLENLWVSFSHVGEKLSGKNGFSLDSSILFNTL